MTRGADGRASVLDPADWPLFYHTATNMHTRQVTGVVGRKLRQAVVPRLPVDFDARYERRVPADPVATPDPIRANTDRIRRHLPADGRAACRRRAAAATRGTVTFLDTPIDVTDGDGATADSPDWFHPALEDHPGLWALKFHGFAFLPWAVFGADRPAGDGRARTDGAAAGSGDAGTDSGDSGRARPASASAAQRVFGQWIYDWAESDDTRIGAPGYLRRAWTPHAVSLRLLHWSRYYAWCVDDADEALCRCIRRLVYRNALFLERHVEHDVGGNHLIENGAALAMAGVLIEGDAADSGHGTDSTDPDRWLETGLDVLGTAADQFLADGGHFERSPMYHAIALQRYLTVLDLLRSTGRQWPDDVERAARRALGFLRSIRPPDGAIPLLNDAVFGEALPLDTCLAYARAVGVGVPSWAPRDALRTSGYYWLGDGENRLLVDGGPPGPAHLPAHSHNDCLSVLLWVDGERLLTDTGTYEYAPTARRQQSRSVRGHGTVQVGTTEPVPIGGRYLAGRRVRPRVRYLHRDGHTVFDGEYTRRRLGGTDYTHRRRIVADGDRWLVQDRVTGAGDRPVRARLHLHPDARSARTDGDCLALSTGGERRAYLLAADGATVTRTTSPYFPEFGVERPRSTIVLEAAHADAAADTDDALAPGPVERERGSEDVATLAFVLSEREPTVETCRELAGSVESLAEDGSIPGVERA